MTTTTALAAIQQRLRSLSDPSNTAFFEKMVPGQQKIYGVKTPDLNAIVQQYKTVGVDLAKALWQSGALEEKIIAIKIIEKIGKKDPGNVLPLFKQFAKKIDNWAVCDGLGMQFLSGIRATHADEIFELATKYNRSKDPWQRRLSLVMVEWYTRKNERTAAISQLVKALEEDKEYYVKKAVVWIKKNLLKGK
jgi:3-methyladenine DNA glycosylase AlkD